MERIELSPLDKKDLLELLEFAKLYKEMTRPAERNKKSSYKWDDYKWWSMRIEQLKAVINGRNVSDSLIGSSLLSLEGFGIDNDKLDERSKKK